MASNKDLNRLKVILAEKKNSDLSQTKDWSGTDHQVGEVHG